MPRATTPRPSRSTSASLAISEEGARPRASRRGARASTTWRCCTRTRATTPRPSRSTSSRWRSGRRPSAPTIRTWRRASTTWRAVRCPGPLCQGRAALPAVARDQEEGPRPRASGRGDEPQQPGGALRRPRPLRQGRAALPAGAGDLEEGPRPRASGRGHEPQQPGGAVLCTRATTPRPSRSTSSRSRSGRRPSAPSIRMWRRR